MQLMWFPLVKATTEYLKSIEGLNDNYNIGILGSIICKDTSKKSTIEVDWDSESDATDTANTRGEVALYIIIKSRSDGTDMMSAYEEQYRVQNLILNSTKILHDYILTNLKIAVKISAAGVAPVGNITRPFYSNQLVMVFEWRKN